MTQAKTGLDRAVGGDVCLPERIERIGSRRSDFVNG
jgi:hypothetical protein